MTPNRIMLICHGRYDEAIGDADVYPGQILDITGGSGHVTQHATKGGAGPVKIAIEDGLVGGDITQKLASGTVVRFYHCISGDVMLFQIAAGQNITKDGKLMSNGDGTLVAFIGSGGTLYEITAASTAISNTGSETAFSNGSYTIPANTLKAGDVVRIKGRVTVTAQNSTNTNNVKVYLGSTAILDAGAVSLAASDVVVFDFSLTFRTVGASGTVVGSGWFAAGTPGTVTQKAVQLASTSVDTTVTQAITVKDTQSAASAGNSARLDELNIANNPVTNALVQAVESVDNSAGLTAAFIRGRVL